MNRKEEMLVLAEMIEDQTSPIMFDLMLSKPEREAICTALRASAAPSDGMTEDALLGWIVARWNFDKGEMLAVKHVVQDMLARFTVALPSDSRKAEPVAARLNQIADNIGGLHAPELRQLAAALTPATEDGWLQREIASIIHRRVKPSSHPVFVDRLCLSGVSDAADEICALSPSPSVGTPAQPSAQRNNGAE